MMNIKQVEKLTGISSQNIRFYEKSGLQLWYTELIFLRL